MLREDGSIDDNISSCWGYRSECTLEKTDTTRRMRSNYRFRIQVGRNRGVDRCVLLQARHPPARGKA